MCSYCILGLAKLYARLCTLVNENQYHYQPKVVDWWHSKASGSLFMGLGLKLGLEGITFMMQTHLTWCRSHWLAFNHGSGSSVLSVGEAVV